MRNHKLETTAETKSCLTRQTVERQAAAINAQVAVSLNRDPLARVTCRAGEGSCVYAHASALNRAAASHPVRGAQSLLRLQQLYGNRYVQRVLAQARNGERGGAASPDVEQAIQRARGGGQALDSGVRTQMEPALGADLRGVRVHADAEADTLNQALNARAFTTGQDIFFRQGAYSPGSSSGRELLAHELTHVVQQNGGKVQRKLAVGQPGDRYEQEADRVARTIARQEQLAQRQIDEDEEEEGETVQAKSEKSWIQRQEEEEEPIQTKMENLRSQEKTGTGTLPTQRPPADQTIQRRVYVSGAVEAEADEYVDILGSAAGYFLTRSFRNPRVRIRGNRPGAPPSPEARAQLRRMINHATQHAEVHVGTSQPGVGIGAFPVAPSMIQLVDIDDIRNLNAAVPGAGTAKAYHELVENWTHHGPGTPGFPPSHRAGVEMESTAAEELGTPGRRMIGRGQLQVIPPPAGMPAGNYRRLTQEFTTYFLQLDYRVNPGNDWQIVGARRVPKVQVSQRTVSRFASNSSAIPAGGNATLNQVVADLNANPNSTVAIEGFTDSRGSRATNLRLSRQRAEEARAFLVAQGIAADRINIVGRGETNFADTNATQQGRANNRRVVLTVHRP